MSCLQVLRVLQAAPALVTLLKGVEAAMTNHASGGSKPLTDATHADVVPFLVDQSMDWSACASASLSPLPSPAVSSFSLLECPLIDDTCCISLACPAPALVVKCQTNSWNLAMYMYRDRRCDSAEGCGLCHVSISTVLFNGQPMAQHWLARRHRLDHHACSSRIIYCPAMHTLHAEPSIWWSLGHGKQMSAEGLLTATNGLVEELSFAPKSLSRLTLCRCQGRCEYLREVPQESLLESRPS